MGPAPTKFSDLARSALHDLHARLGARFVDFGGWEMPVQYESVLGEHRAVRSGAGWFDVSHLGRFRWQGAQARSALRALVSNDVDLIEPGRTQYTLLLNDRGGIDDDLLIWQWEDDLFWVLPNASTHESVMARFSDFDSSVRAEDLRQQSVMIAIQGPEAPRLIEELLGVAPRRYRTYKASYEGAPVFLAGTGYTGERGGEVVTDPATAENLIDALNAAGVTPCGLGARDTLRLEAGLLLAGQDFDSDTTPHEAGLDFAVSWDHDFVGAEALRQAEPAERNLIAFTLPGRLIPRHGHRLRTQQAQGAVTSGNFSPMLEQGIGIGYVSPPDSSDPEVEIRGSWEQATAVSLPFYRK